MDLHTCWGVRCALEPPTDVALMLAALADAPRTEVGAYLCARVLLCGDMLDLMCTNAARHVRIWSDQIALFDMHDRALAGAVWDPRLEHTPHAPPLLYPFADTPAFHIALPAAALDRTLAVALANATRLFHQRAFRPHGQTEESDAPRFALLDAHRTVLRLSHALAWGPAAASVLVGADDVRAERDALLAELREWHLLVAPPVPMPPPHLRYTPARIERKRGSGAPKPKPKIKVVDEDDGATAAAS